MLAADGGAQDLVGARLHQHLHQPLGLAVGDRAIEVVDAVGDDLVRDLLHLRLGLVQADARDLRVGERRPRHDGVVHAEFPEAAEEAVVFSAAGCTNVTLIIS